ncbi:SusD/RagB family nutrient-binding outer membrane lipoprotein [Flavobacterium sp. XS2P12]|uniref:SusD/RagB family nutrient-binding outer membrane lipoprotein n=1 Tax=Flavobacterium melibiosi TaxID=3398734 RepID=UPI003A85CE85
MKKILYSSMMMLLLFTSCESYLDVNEDQTNKPFFTDLSPKQMLAGAVNNYTNHQIITLGNYGNRVAYVWGLNSGFTSTDPAWTYIFDSSSYETNFENSYLFADNFQDILDKEAQFPEYSYHYGIAKVMKVMSMDYVTALYGDAPYSEAFSPTITAPKYDDDKTIIPALFLELDKARAYFESPSADVIDLGSEDIVFGGNTAEWLKFINTVELRLLLRLSKTTDAALVTLRTSRFAVLNANQNFVTSDVTVNPGYNTSTLNSRTPVFRAYGQNESFSAATSANAANAAGDFAARLVNGTLNDANITTGIVDPRRSRIFTLVGGTVVGNVQGIFPLTAISKIASFYHGRTGANAAIANKNGAERDAYLMQAAESHFLQAEARQRGFLTGSAKAEFDAGVTASFNFYSTGFGTIALAALDPVAYLASIDAKNGLGWTGSTNKISAIMTQKYIALAEWNGIELYIDHMRTGFPVLPLPFGVNATTRPNRLIYPTSEYSSNSANVPTVTNAELFTVNAKTPYYLQ